MASGYKKTTIASQGSDDVFESTTHGDRTAPIHGYSSEPQCHPGGNQTAITTGPTSPQEQETQHQYGQRASGNFRSSGYSTGSEESACQPSVQSFPENSCLGQASTTPEDKYGCPKEKCVENDFKPKNGRSLLSSVQNTVPKETVQIIPSGGAPVSVRTQIFLPLRETQLSTTAQEAEATLPARGARTSQPAQRVEARPDGDLLSSDVAKLVYPTSKEHIITEPKQDHPQLFSTSNISTQEKSDFTLPSSNLDKMNRICSMVAPQTQSNVSGISKTDMKQSHAGINMASQPQVIHLDSKVSQSDTNIPHDSIPSTMTQAWTKPPLTRQNVLVSQHTRPESTEWPGTLGINLDQMPSTNPEQASDFSDNTPSLNSSYYLSTGISYSQFDMDLLKILEKSARCKRANCDDYQCEQIKKALTSLGLRSWRQRDRTEDSDYKLLQAMFYHARACHLENCPFTWCGNTNIPSEPSEDGLQLMKERLENLADSCRWISSPVIKFVKMEGSIIDNFLPEEGRDWLRLCMLRNSRKTVLAVPLNFDPCFNYTYWVIKKVAAQVDSEQWDLYCKLRDVSHKSVVSFLWMAGFQNHLLVFRLFENLSLEDCLPVPPHNHLGLVPSCQIMQQLVSATKHLNQLGIVYLYWASKNIFVDYHNKGEFYVKIGNFSLSTLLDKYNDERLLQTLPPSLVAPELRESHQVKLVSDVWGLGCLLHELVTGDPVWYDQRHIPDKDLHEKLKYNPVPKMPTVFPELLALFQACWEVDWKKEKFR